MEHITLWKLDQKQIWEGKPADEKKDVAKKKKGF
ncbi:hypothetical protein CCACVL1_00202 [Corchorus capsularis]|uniref:Uncharacterized protein n=1 Tax=Corchorus capsularis TaxID=210143 RepID=A0A1R3KY30_COCAP|nr:hypothetical protein CCACVL1_00202 [Corchorus capsularis]